jgi:hypothetical protein
MHRLILALVVAFVTSNVIAPAPNVLAKKKAPAPGLVYVNDGGTKVYGFTIAADGSLAELSGGTAGDSPFPTDVDDPASCTDWNCQTIAYSEARHLLFLGTHDGIVVFKVLTDGSLRKVPGGPFGDTEIVGVAAFESGNKLFVYGAAADDDQVLAFRTEKDGSLTGIGHAATGHTPFGISQADEMLFVVNADDFSISAFRISQSGGLSEGVGSPLTPDLIGTIVSVFSVKIDPNVAHLYTGDVDDHDVFGLSANKKHNPILRSMEDSPFPADDDILGTGAGLALSGKLVIAIERVSNDPGGTDLQVFTRDKHGKLLTLGSVQDSDLDDIAVGIATTSGKRLILAGHDDADDVIRSYDLNTATGKITEVKVADSNVVLSASIDHGLNGIVVTKP